MVSVLNENQKLKERILVVESQPAEPEARFATPDSISKDGSGQAERSFGIETTRLQGLNLEKVFGKGLQDPQKRTGQLAIKFSLRLRDPQKRTVSWPASFP